MPLTCFRLDESLSQFYRPITWTSKRTGTALSADVVAPSGGKPSFATFLHSNDRRKTLRYSNLDSCAIFTPLHIPLGTQKPPGCVTSEHPATARAV